MPKTGDLTGAHPAPTQKPSNGVVRHSALRRIPREEFIASRELRVAFGDMLGEALPPPACDDMKTLAAIMEQIAAGEMAAWAVESEHGVLVAIAVSFNYKNTLLNRNVMNLFAFKRFKRITEPAMRALLAECYKVALLSECDDVEFVTRDRAVHKLATKLGFSTQFHCVKNLKEH